MGAIRSRAGIVAVAFLMAGAGSFSPIGVAPSLAVDAITGLYFDGSGFPAGGVPTNRGADAIWAASIGIDPSILTVTVDSFGFTFASAPGSTLTSGTYTNAVRAAFRGAGQNGVDVMSGSTGCSTVNGSFTVIELTVVGSAVTAAAIDFEIHCESQAPAIYGSLRFGSSEGYRGIEIDPFPYPPPLAIGSAVVGESAHRTVDVMATGTEPLAISDVSTTGADFSIAGEDCVGTLPGGASCSVTVEVTPSALGERTGTLSIDDDALAGGHSYDVSGVGVAAVLNPAAVDFGTIDQGTAVTQTITLENGPSPLTGMAPSFLNPGVDFSVSSKTCGSTLAANATCTYTIRYRPWVAGPTEDFFLVDTNEVGQLSAAISGVGRIATDISWGQRRSVGLYTWNEGAALAWSQPGATDWLHSAASSAVVGGKVVKDAGPYEPILYRRSTTAGRTWESLFRVNSTSQHGDRPTIAAAQTNVYVGWVRLKKVVNYSPTAARVLYVRANTGTGASAKWKSTHRLTSLSGRVGYPVIAAAGSSAYIVWTNSVTGAIRVAISHDRGATWLMSTLGSTTLSSSDGFDGYPSIAASGDRVTMAWTANGDGAVKTRTSTTSGGSWGATETLATTSNGLGSVAVLGTRSAVTWSSGRTVHVQVLTDVTWGPDRTLLPPGDPSYFESSWFPVAALQGSSRVAVAFSACVTACPANANRLVELIWAESTDDGASWATQVVGFDGQTSQRVLPSVVWPTPTLRYVMWNQSPAVEGVVGLFVRRGVGSP